jgi:hypothetical protein
MAIRNQGRTTVQQPWRTGLDAIGLWAYLAVVSGGRPDFGAWLAGVQGPSGLRSPVMRDEGGGGTASRPATTDSGLTKQRARRRLTPTKATTAREEEATMSDRDTFSKTARSIRRSAEVASEVLARRVYEICVTRGYVDERDWREAEAELRGEVREHRPEPTHAVVR